MEEEVAFIQEKMSEGTQTNEDTVKWDPEETELVSTKEKQIKFDVFEKVELKVAEVINCQKVEGADKLLQFRLDAGDSQDRQILSGIAEFYPDPSELIGKKSRHCSKSETTKDAWTNQSRNDPFCRSTRWLFTSNRSTKIHAKWLRNRIEIQRGMTLVVSYPLFPKFEKQFS